jgi:hypothetical protein
MLRMTHAVIAGRGWQKPDQSVSIGENDAVPCRLARLPPRRPMAADGESK